MTFTPVKVLANTGFLPSNQPDFHRMVPATCTIDGYKSRLLALSLRFDRDGRYESLSVHLNEEMAEELYMQLGEALKPRNRL